MRGAAIVLLALALGACGEMTAPAIAPAAHPASAVHPKDDGATRQVPVTGRPGSAGRFSDGDQPEPPCQSQPMAEKGICPAGDGR